MGGRRNGDGGGHEGGTVEMVLGGDHGGGEGGSRGWDEGMTGLRDLQGQR